MSRRVFVSLAAVLAVVAAATPARALNTPAQQIGDVYALTKSGTVYRIPSGSTTPQVELTLGSYDAEWIDFDPGAKEFIIGPGLDLAGTQYKRLPQLLTSGGGDIPGTQLFGGHGGAVDRFRAMTAGRSDLLIADPQPGIVGVVRIRGDNNISTALSVAPQGYSVPEDVEVNYANGEIFVSVQATSSLPGAILRYNNGGGFIEAIPMAGGQDPFCLVFDNTDAVPYYDMVAAGFNGTKQIFLVDVDNDRPVGQPRVKLLGNAPTAGAECDDLAISHGGSLIYPDATGGNLYLVNLTTGAATLLASVPGVKSVAFISRNALAALDRGPTLGNFQKTTGPNGRSAVRATAAEPEFSSGLIYVEATGINLAVNGVPLPYRVWIDARRELTKFTFVAEKIDNSIGASIKLVAIDAAGNIGDPPSTMITVRKDVATVTTIDLTGIKKRWYHDVYVTNNGVLTMTVEYGGKTYNFFGDPAMKKSGLVVWANGTPSPRPMVINGWTILRFEGEPPSMTITVPAGNPDGKELFIKVD